MRGNGSSACEQQINSGIGTAEVAGLSVDELCADARDQELRFVSGLPSSDAAGVELFRRAIEQHDEAAWSAVVLLYQGLLTAYCGRLLVRGLVHEDDQFCVERAFERFWRATRAAGLG